MTEPTEAAKAKARELMRERVPGSAQNWPTAFARYIQQVSDVAKDIIENSGEHITIAIRPKLKALILPPDPDPLEEALSGIVPILPTPYGDESHASAVARELRAGLDRAGYEIRKKDQP